MYILVPILFKKQSHYTFLKFYFWTILFALFHVLYFFLTFNVNEL